MLEAGRWKRRACNIAWASLCHACYVVERHSLLHKNWYENVTYDTLIEPHSQGAIQNCAYATCSGSHIEKEKSALRYKQAASAASLVTNQFAQNIDTKRPSVILVF